MLESHAERGSNQDLNHRKKTHWQDIICKFLLSRAIKGEIGIRLYLSLGYAVSLPLF